MHRPYWTTSFGESVGRYLVIWSAPETMPMLMIMLPSGILCPMSGSHVDILADDWELYE